MAIARAHVQENMPQGKSYEEMLLAAIGAINDDVGSTEHVILQYISSSYGVLIPSHPDLIREKLKILIREKMIGFRPAYFIKHPNEGFNDHTALYQYSPKIVEEIQRLNEKGGSTECSITEYIHNRFNPESCSHLKIQFEMLVKVGVLGINNIYFLLAKGRFWLNRIHVPYYNDPSLEMWRRHRTNHDQATTSVAGNSMVGTASIHWKEIKAKIKMKSIAAIMQETKPRALEMGWSPEC